MLSNKIKDLDTKKTSIKEAQSKCRTACHALPTDICQKTKFIKHLKNSFS